MIETLLYSYEAVQYEDRRSTIATSTQQTCETPGNILFQCRDIFRIWAGPYELLGLETFSSKD